MSTLVERVTTLPRRPLSTIAAEIQSAEQEAMSAAKNAAMPHWRRTGSLLNEARGDHFAETPDEFFAWSKRQFGYSETTTRKRMALAELPAAAARRAITQSAALGWTTSPDIREPARRAAIRATASRVWHEERRNADRERDLLKRLARELVTIGYRALAPRLHPDRRGGSSEAMQRLNRVKKLLLDAVERIEI